MSLSRRHVLGAAVASAALSKTWPSFAQTQDYPNRPIRMLVPNPPGGGTDTLARILVPSLSAQLGQQVIVESRAGGSGFVAVDTLLQAPPDGYTLLLLYSGILTVNPSIFKGRIRYDSLRDFATVAPVAEVPNVLIVNSSLPVKSVSDLIAMAKAQPGKLSYASSGNGVSNHLAMELFKQLAGVDIVHIPYRGDAPALVDLLGGHVQAAFANMATVSPHLKNPKLRVLAVATSKRLKNFPDIPTVSESGLPGYDMKLWYGIVAKAGTPSPIVDKLNAAVRVAQDSQEVKARFAAMDATPMIQSQDEFRDTIRQDIQKWAQVVERGHITVD